MRAFKISLVACIAMLFGLTQANANTSGYTLDINTFDASQWQVATLFTSNNAGYVNPSKSGGNYNNASSATQWGSFNVDWANLTWSVAEQGVRDTWTDETNWAALLGTSTNESKVANGFYAFSYTMTAAEISAEIVSITGELSFVSGVDDYIAAIYINGVELYSEKIVQGASVGDDTNKNGNWLSLSDLNFNVDLTDTGELEILVIVHNTNAAGSNNLNPMGLYIDGTITTSVQMLPPGEEPSPNIEDPTTTPEPATLAVIGIGMGGAFLARRRMKKVA